MLGKNLTPEKILLPDFWEKKLLHKQNHPYSYSKVKWSAPKLNSKNKLIINKQEGSRNKKMSLALSHQELRKP